MWECSQLLRLSGSCYVLNYALWEDLSECFFLACTIFGQAHIKDSLIQFTRSWWFFTTHGFSWWTNNPCFGCQKIIPWFFMVKAIFFIADSPWTALFWPLQVMNRAARQRPWTPTSLGPALGFGTWTGNIPETMAFSVVSLGGYHEKNVSCEMTIWGVSP